MRIIQRIRSIIAKQNPVPCRKVGDINRIEAAAVQECATPNTCHTIRNCDTRKAAAAQERATSNTCHAIRDDKVCDKSAVQIQIMRIIQRIRSIIAKQNPVPCRKVGDINRIETAAVQECTIPDARRAAWNCDACEAAAAAECITLDARHAVRDDKVCDKFAIQIQIMRIIQRIRPIIAKRDPAPYRKVGDINRIETTAA